MPFGFVLIWTPVVLHYIKIQACSVKKLYVFFYAKNQENENIDLTEKLNFIGYFEGENKQLKSIEEVADFICENGKYGDNYYNE